MMGLIYVIAFSIIVSALLVVPVFRLLFGRRKRGMGGAIFTVAFLMILFSYSLKSMFTVLVSVMPLLIATGFLGIYMGMKRVRRNSSEKRIERTFNALILMFFAFYFFFAVFGKAWIGVPFSGLSDAEQTDRIEYSVDFNNLRLVPPALAGALSKTKNTYSNYHVGEKDVYYDPVEMRLKWIAGLEPDNILIGLSRTSPGYIEGYAGGTLNPSVDFFEKELEYTEERPFLNNVYTRVWLADPTHEYGDALLAKTNGEYLWIIPLMRNYYGIVMTYDGVAVVNAMSGETDIYGTEDMPAWLAHWRTYPEEVALWRVSVYSLFKNGVANAFFFKNDIDEIPVNTEPYLINIDDEVYWFVSVEPAGGQEKRALSGYYLIGANGGNAGSAIFVNKKQKNFIGPTVASNYVQSKVSNFNGWAATQPLLYPYRGEETWVVPILYVGGELAGMKLVGVGFVDTATEEVSIIRAEDEAPDTSGGIPGSRDELIEEYQKYRDEIRERLDRIDEIVDKLGESK